MTRFAPILALLLVPGVASGTSLRVPGDHATIQAAFDAAAAGDSILVHPGTYRERPVSDKGVTVIGVDGPEVTTIDGGDVESVLYIGNGPGSFVLEGLRIVGAGTDMNFGWPYPAITHSSIDLTIRNCRIESFQLYAAVVTDCTFLPDEGGIGNGNYAYGAALFEHCIFEGLVGQWGATGLVVGDDVTVRNCVFRGCNGSGFAPVVGYDAAWATPVIEGNLFVDCVGPCIGPAQWPPVHPRGDPPAVGSGFVTVRQNTFVRNEHGPLGPYPSGPAYPFVGGAFDANVVTGSELGVWLPPVPYTLTCNDSWGNESNWTGFPDPTGSDGNISQPPFFCGPLLGDFTVASNSPLLPYNNSCEIRIGAFGEGCGVVSIEEESWGGIKARYRTR